MENGRRSQVACWFALMKTTNFMYLFFVLLVYWPRGLLSYAVFGVAQLLRFFAKTIGTASGQPLANRRILLITDFSPSLTDGIAIRCQAYAKQMRSQGHYVVVFSTASDPAQETCFDCPNIPSVPNPFDLTNRIGYTAGVKLAWNLGAYTWDVVHVMYPSVIGGFVVSCCCWRGIPTYCSHHVDMETYVRNAPRPLDRIGLLLYNSLCKPPALRMATINAAPTLCFAKSHCGDQQEDRLRRIPSGAHDVFTALPDCDGERSHVRQSVFGVLDDKTTVVLMVQRLSNEKNVEHVFSAFSPLSVGGGGIGGVLVIAGEGPSRRVLEVEARKRRLPVVFLGKVPHGELPKVYRAADCLVTTSVSETFSLPCLEALVCGCPAVMPHCDVFDEIWSDRIPETWRYHAESTHELCLAIIAASNQECGGGRRFLQANPVRQTWSSASAELLQQYEDCIRIGRQTTLHKRYTADALIHWVRVLGIILVAAFVSSHYYVAIRRFGKQLEKNGVGFF
eukprot:TRINITY_DN54692_c0_g1_i1.p1 TRINITY_DN54692_c0_g1~~TRINITY_DN54692_c0_g1_i1.p1  ORF type:complete len:531 (+),score=67.85 TRINITY_DN54692_c0_g1_i1:75-1595(+)